MSVNVMRLDMVARVKLVCFVGYCRLIILALLVTAGVVSADDSARSEKLAAIYDYSGVEAHLQWVQSTVLEESQLAWQACVPEVNHAATKDLLTSTLSIAALRRGYIDELASRISDDQIDAVIAWTNSDAGQNIHKAEADSVNFDDQAFEAKLAAYQESGEHDEARSNRLKSLLADTGAVYFLSALNTELSALVFMAGICSYDAEGFAAADKLIKEERGSEALYRSFMRQGLVLPSGVVYQGITDADIDALLTFAASDAGKAYYTALIQGVRSLLEGEVASLRLALDTMPKSD